MDPSSSFGLYGHIHIAKYEINLKTGAGAPVSNVKLRIPVSLVCL
jgi:hypothetical protein